MKKAQLKIAKKLTASRLAELALASVQTVAIDIQELLLQSKNEQTFSGLLASYLQHDSEMLLGSALPEIKGVSMKRGNKFYRNTHDVAILNDLAEIEIIIENKVWFHFDGAKGRNVANPEPGIKQGLDQDINKIRNTLKNIDINARGFILLYLMTPANIDKITERYLGHHRKAFARTERDWDSYRREGVSGVSTVFSTFKKYFASPVVIKSMILESNNKLGFLDIFCVEIGARTHSTSSLKLKKSK